MMGRQFRIATFRMALATQPQCRYPRQIRQGDCAVRIGKAIAHISTYEHQFGRPLLSALVVQAGTNRASDGFAELCRDLGHQIQPDQERVYWRGQVEAVAVTGEAMTARSRPDKTAAPRPAT